MTSLEFIEKEIKELEFQINYIKSNMKKYIDFRTEGQLEVDMKQLKLKYLQQIKSELEAWYSIKQGIKLCEGKVYEDSYYEYLQFEEELFDESESEDAGERLTPIKKALEVKE